MQRCYQVQGTKRDVRHPGTGHRESYYHPQAHRDREGSRATGTRFKVGDRGEARAHRGTANPRTRQKKVKGSADLFFLSLPSLVTGLHIENPAGSQMQGAWGMCSMESTALGYRAGQEGSKGQTIISTKSSGQEIGGRVLTPA